MGAVTAGVWKPAALGRMVTLREEAAKRMGMIVVVADGVTLEEVATVIRREGWGVVADPTF